MPDTGDRKEFRDRCFEVQKHVSTISTAASLLILAVFRERPFEKDLLAITLVLLAMCALAGIQGMTSLALYERGLRRTVDPDPEAFDRYIYGLTSFAANVLTAAVVVFALFLFDVPVWKAIGVVAALLVLVLLVLWRRHRKATRSRRRSPRP